MVDFSKQITVCLSTDRQTVIRLLRQKNAGSLTARINSGKKADYF